MAYLGKTPSQATRQRYYFTASGSETSVSGADDNSNTLVFTDGNYIDVILNGSTLVAGTDYNTTTANTVSGLAALSASDIIEIVVYDTFSVFGGNVNGDFNFGDNNKAIFGAGSDLQIYHDGSASRIDDAGTGDLILRSSSIQLQKYTGETMAGFVADGAVTLRYDNVSKLATTASGIDVTGAISSNKGSAGTLATFTDGVNSNFVVETSSLLTTIGNGGGSASLAFKANNTEAMRINSSGYVGIGTISPAVELEIASSAPQMRITDTDTNATFQINAASTTGGVELQADATNVGSNPFIAFDVGGSEKMRIDDSGKVYVGTTTNANSGAMIVQQASNGTGITVNGVNNTSGAVFMYFTEAGGNCGYIQRVGTTSAVTYATSSDYRLKQNVQPMTGALAKVSLLNPVTYDWIAGGSSQGFIAHELQEVIPEAVTGVKDQINEDGSVHAQGVDTSYVVATLTAALQEALTKIEQLETRITALEA
jgi:hypothetical protein